jgi:hypothetical protein
VHNNEPRADVPPVPNEARTVLSSYDARVKEYQALLKERPGSERLARQLAQVEVQKEFCSDHHIPSPWPDPKYDAVYCLRCRAWLDAKCGYKSCSYCSQRPERCE